MEIKVLFQKEGIVPVGTSETNQIVNLKDPIGQPVSINFNFKTGIVKMVIKSWDDRNEIIREFDLDFPIEYWQQFLMTTFSQNIRPLAKETFPEFDGLNELGVQIIP
jgi:tyrosine-protein phosphatase YwqE